jgi:hypothetical protein
MRIAISWIGALSFCLGGAFGAVAQSRNAPEDHWLPVDKSMTDLLQEGYRLISVVGPSPQVRIYFLSNGGLVAKCTEEAALARPPPPPRTPQLPPSTQLPPIAQRAPSFDARDYTPEIEATIECSRLSKSR